MFLYYKYVLLTYRNCPSAKQEGTAEKSPPTEQTHIAPAQTYRDKLKQHGKCALPLETSLITERSRWGSFFWSILVKVFGRSLWAIIYLFIDVRTYQTSYSRFAQSQNSPHRYFLFFFFWNVSSKKATTHKSLISSSFSSFTSHYNKQGCFQRIFFALGKNKVAEQELLKDSLLHLYRPKANSHVS